MKRTLPILAVLTLLFAGGWVWALRQGPGKLELPPLAPWPKALAAAPAPEVGVALSGVLRHADGTPAADALIQVTTPAGTRWDWTSGSGAFTLTALPADPEIRAELEFGALALEHMPATFRLESPPTARVTWILPPPTRDLEAMPALVIGDFHGSLTRALGPTEGLEVWLVPPPGIDPLTGQIERRATVATDGSFAFPSLTAGVYQARILPAWARGGSWPILGTGALPFDPKSNQPVPRLATLEGRITGRVFDDHGEPLAGAMLLVSPSESDQQVWPPAQSGPAGFFQVDDLPPGLYHLELVSGKAHQELEVRVSEGGVTEARFNLVDV
jgi:hypothetical protein